MLALLPLTQLLVPHRRAAVPAGTLTWVKAPAPSGHHASTDMHTGMDG